MGNVFRISWPRFELQNAKRDAKMSQEFVSPLVSPAVLNELIHDYT